MAGGGNTFRAALLVSLSWVLVEGTNPGFVGRITRKGLDYARQEGIGVLQRELPRVRLDDISGNDENWYGDIRYSFHRMSIHSFQLPSSTITPIPNLGLKVSISNAYAELSGRWEWKHWLASDHGGFDLNVEGISIPVSLKISSNYAGRPTVTTAGCSTYISNIRVHVHGTWTSWFYNLFDGTIGSAIKRTMERQICPVVSRAVSSRLQPYLQTLPVMADIDTVSGIDYSLVGPPVATNNFLDFNLKGEFFSPAHRSAPPFPPPALALPVDHDRMLYFGVSSYLFNTAGYVYHQAGAMTYEITDEMIPGDAVFRLNTSFFGSVVPQIQELYPNMLMKLEVLPSSPPSLSIAPDSLSLAPAVDVRAFAILPNSSLASLFLLNVSTTVLATAAMESKTIVGSLKIGTLELSLKHSDVGPFSVEFMQDAMNAYAEVLVPQINKRLAQGVPVPLPDDLKLSNLFFRLHQNFLLFGVDVRYVW